MHGRQVHAFRAWRGHGILATKLEWKQRMERMMSMRISEFRNVCGLLLTCFALLLFEAACSPVNASNDNAIQPPRQILPLSGAGWQFLGGGNADLLPTVDTPGFESADWKNVTVPNDFQTRSDMSTEQGWYRRSLTVPGDLAGKRLYLVFEGSATISDVYVNGKALGEHRGAYTRFVFDATDALHTGPNNEVAVLVDNRKQSTTDCLPCASGLYTVWGGLYRHVWLLAVNNLHIDPTYYASPGVFITPGPTNAGSAPLDVKVMLRNTSTSSLSTSVIATIIAPNGQSVTTISKSGDVAAGQRATVDLSGSVANPLQWSPDSPNLYHVRVDVASGGRTWDSIVQPLGFHNITWDFTNGLFKLNGRPYKLFGCDLHQETEDRLSAVEPADLTANFDAMQDLGVNFVRLSHYPRAQLEYDLCDERGIFCWSENGHSHTDLACPTTDQITTEMVAQNYNHPSIIIWSVGNEGNGAPADREVPVVKALDPTRPVFVANMGGSFEDYHARNTYPGWYGGDRWTFEPKGLISEIGVGGDPSTHTDYADASFKVNEYEPEEYQQEAAEAIFELAFRRDGGRLGMFTWWILRDFNDIKYKASTAPFHHGINSKGLETYAGDKKDIYYLYRAFLRPDTPTVHITSKHYFLRLGNVDNGIKVYSNAKAITLTLNGTVVSTQQNGQYSQVDPANNTGSGEVDNVFFWKVPLQKGKNFVAASDGLGHSDLATIYFYGADGLPAKPDSNPLIMGLTSSNPANACYFMDTPVQAQWPVYYDFNSEADNSLDSLPAPVAGAYWLALRRFTLPGQGTTIGFTAARPATIFMICDKSAGPAADGSFRTVATPPFQWRRNDTLLNDAQLLARHVNANEKVSITLGDRDALLLLKAD
jgi:beta-galactosidase